jgi:outer membrane protein TolC
MAEFRRQVEQTVTDVIGRYWAVVLARRERMIQQELLDRTIETRDRIDKRRLLDATEVEFMQSEAAVATRRAGLIRAGKLIIDAQDDLARLLADSQLNVLSDREIVPTTPPNVEPVRLDMTDQLITALRYNPILEQARKATAIAAINVTVAKSETLPRLDLRASTTFHGLAGSVHQAGENLETGDFIGHQIAIEAEYPIGNRQRIANLRAQRLGQLKAIATLQSIADQVAVQLRERIRQVETAYEEMKAQKLAVGASRNQLEALDATEQLRGLTPEFLQVKLNAQESLANAERAELRATIDYNVALVEVARAAGTVLELNRVRIAMPATPQDATDQHAPLPTSEPSK